MQVVQQIGGFLTTINGGMENLVVANTSTGLTPSKYNPTASQDARDEGHARMAFITIDGADVWYTLDTTVPVFGTTGHYLPNGSSLTLANYTGIVQLRMISQSGAANARVTYFR